MGVFPQALDQVERIQQILDEQTDGWAWGQSQIDGYVGYVPAECLMAGGAAPNSSL